MSTRGWYECYVVDDARQEVSLGMQFYRWGDAVPENALAERDELESVIDHFGGRLPVELVGGLLRDNLGEAFEQLPLAFPLGCYAFLLLRAAEEVRSPFRKFRYARLPKEERPDYQLGFAVGLAEGRQRLKVRSTGDPVVDRAHFFIRVGHLVRRWSDCSADMPFLSWLQYLTQDTLEVDMGLIAGNYECPLDVAFQYRLFLRVPGIVPQAQPVSSVGLEFCAPGGMRLLEALAEQIAASNRSERKHLEAERDEILRLTDSAELEPISLEELRATHTEVPSPFWGGPRPRGSYLGP